MLSSKKSQKGFTFSRINPFGFTLVELLVAISIVAILAVIGLTIFQGLQRQARDSRRSGDLDSIASTLETNYMSQTGECKISGDAANGGTYCPMRADYFSANKVPADPGGGVIDSYCIAWDFSDTVPGDPPSSWTGAGCPTGYSLVADGTPDLGSTVWKVCAMLESGTVQCRANRQ